MSRDAVFSLVVGNEKTWVGSWELTQYDGMMIICEMNIIINVSSFECERLEIERRSEY